MHAYDTPAWIEKPSLGVGRVKILMAKEVFPFDAGQDRVVEERDNAEKEVLTRVSGRREEKL